jgi:DNA primase large subunit
MPANGRLCKDCSLMEHQEDYYGVPADGDGEDGDDD